MQGCASVASLLRVGIGVYVAWVPAFLFLSLCLAALGLGTWLAAKGEVGNAVYAALKAGYRAIDCAAACVLLHSALAITPASH